MLRDNWRTLEIKDVGRVVTGRTPSEHYPEHFGFEMPFITPSDMDGSRVIDSPGRWLSQAGATALSRNIIPKGVAVSCIGWQLGKTVLVKQPSVTNQQINSIIPNDSVVDMLFLYYALLPRREEIFRLAAGGSRTPIMKKSAFERLTIDLPPLPEQRAIAHILGSLDDMIELNRRMNATLEAIAQALFKSWFVDFDPVRAKAEGRQPYGMDADTAALFPTSFQDSVLGEIPEGWQAATLADVADITMGQSPPGETYNEASLGLPFYQGTRDFGFRFPSRRVYCTAPTRLAQEGDVLLSVRAPVGSLNIATEHCAIGRGIAALRQRTKPAGFLYYLLRATQQEWDSFNAEGTVFGAVSKADIYKFKIILPPPKLHTTFGELIASMDDLILNNELEQRYLTTLRDTLLPKLLSGEIRVKEAEELVEAHA